MPVIVVGGYPRFQYGGFWFALVDPWPEYWANDWYDRDEFYVDYIGDGYYLCDRRHSDVRLRSTSWWISGSPGARLRHS
ncbi:MAG: hypothetical protein HYX26_03840 [Acidobacteriales bacterium]|nr:hypothetical protein [Terriglobales bacterium]